MNTENLETNHEPAPVPPRKRDVSRRELLMSSAGVGLAAMAASASASAAGKGTSARRRPSAEDRLDIMELFARYSWSYDCSDVHGYAATFTPDGVIEAFGKEAARGREAIAKFLPGIYALRGDDDWQHHNDHFIFDGDDKACTVYNYWALLQRKHGSDDYSVRSFGYYVSLCVNIDGEWLIKKRSINHWDHHQLPWTDVARAPA
jgi:hypothetical protein